MSYVQNKDTKKGYDYKKYMFGSENKTLTFGKTGTDNDVYVYDATGKVFYAKGVYVEGGVYYSDILTQDGPIINVVKTYNETSNVVDMAITIAPVTEGNNVDVRIDNSMALDEDDENTYSYTATSNGIYVVSAEEDELTSVKRVKVSEITEGEYNITYHFQDGTTPNETIKKQGSLPIRLKAVKREGYVHVGWAKDASAVEVDYAPGEIFAENADTDLYAIWELGEAREYTITFNANGGENAPSPITKIERASVSLPLDEPTYANHVFLGWSLSSTATEAVYRPGANYSEEGDTVLFAVWAKGDIRVDITANPEEGGTAVGGGIKEEGSIVYITAVPNPGYSFYKWSVTSGNVKLDNNYSETTKFVMPKGTVKITVNFKKTDYDYTIKYNANNGFGAPNTQYKKHDENINISTTIPTRSAHKFLGWSDKLNSSTVKYLPGAVYDKNESTTLYAVWQKNVGEYTLTFDANGGTKAPSSITAVKDSIVRIPTETPIRSNLLFLGWAKTKDAKDVEYRKNDYYTLSESATLYAVWSDSEKPIVSITAEEKENRLVLNGYAIDNGGIIQYAWTNEFYSESEQGSISWTSLSSAKSEITIKNEVLQSGIHCFYVKDENGNVSHASIDVYKMSFYNESVLFETKFKASGYPASMSQNEPWKEKYVFSKWKAQTDGRLYSVDEDYLLERDEKFVATWNEAYAYIPSTNWYYITLQKAVDAVQENTTDYVEVQLIKTETTSGVTIPNNKQIAVSMSSNILKCAQTAITIENDAKFKLLDGTIQSDIYGIRNAGTLVLLTGKITAPNGVYNTGAMTLGDVSAEFSKTSMVISSTKASYSVGGTLATLYFVNGSLEDTNEETTYELPSSGLTLRKNFELRKITGANGTGSASKIITTIVEDLIITREVTAGSEAKPVEIKLTLSLGSPSSEYVFQYSEDGSTWKNGTEVIIIDNKTVYGRILEDGVIANTEQLTVSDIVDLVVEFDADGIITDPTSKTVKYKRTYGDVIPDTTDTDKYYFRGWWTAASGGTQVTSSTIVTDQGDHTLYAHWEKINEEPVITELTMTSSTTTSMTIRATATDEDEDDMLIYKLYFNGSSTPVYTSQETTPGNSVTYTVSGLTAYNEYKYYNYRIEVYDGSDTVSRSGSSRTKCTGGGYTDGVYCSGGSYGCCTGSTCSICRHSKHSSSCTSESKSVCGVSDCVNGYVPNYVNHTECNGKGYKITYTNCTKCDSNYTVACTGSWSYGTCGTCKSTQYRSCSTCGYAWCPGCMSEGNTAIYGSHGRVPCTCNNGKIEEHPPCSCSNGKVQSGTTKCSNCDGGYVYSTCGCTHNAYSCQQTDTYCTHSKIASHYYCKTHGINYLSSSTTSHCSHGYTSAH